MMELMVCLVTLGTNCEHTAFEYERPTEQHRPVGAVPEPSAMVLFGIGIGAGAIAIKLRRRDDE
jgi:hypothetical protein